ncbi:MAG TPA: T9SS type A sorting domain-containing protein [Ohtaekwangia sp.]|uniref:T9SS type A sorting domain-containing protein n=1 Tax=Ohtaekwangia sp. TaxID=2066019 RepID=UPI002F921A8A
MRKILLLAMITILTRVSFGQGFEVVNMQDTYRGMIGETIKAPIRFKNTSDKTITLIIRKVDAQIGSTQKNFFCLDNNCLDQKTEDYILKVDPGQTISSFQIALEAGLVSGESTVRYVAYSKSHPSQAVEFTVNFSVEEKAEKQSLYTSRFIDLHDVYPNPVTDNAFVEYKILNEQVKAKIIMHNLLGNPVGDYPLPSTENRVRIKVDELSAGIYFYTLYLDNEGVMTRKLIVKK